MDEIYEEKNKLGTFQTKILDWYDRPLLKKCTDEHGEQFLAVFWDDEKWFEQYLYIPVSDERMKAFLKGKISLRDIHVKAEKEPFYLVSNYGDGVINVSKIDEIFSKDLKEDSLPGKDSYTNYEEN